MKYIRSTDGRWPVAVLCRVMQVSEAGYYKYLKRPAGIDRHAPLLATIYEILKENPENANYGVKRIFPALKINRGYGGGRIRPCSGYAQELSSNPSHRH